LHDVEAATENHFSGSLQRVRKSCVLGWIKRWRIEDNVVDNKARAILR